MKLKTSNKTVMFYGHVLRVNVHAKWIAVDENGVMRAFEDEPYIPHNQPEEQHGVWVVPQRYEIDAVRIGSFEPGVDNDIINTLRHYPIEDE